MVKLEKDDESQPVNLHGWHLSIFENFEDQLLSAFEEVIECAINERLSIYFRPREWGDPVEYDNLMVNIPIDSESIIYWHFSFLELIEDAIRESKYDKDRDLGLLKKQLEKAIKMIDEDMTK